MNVETITFIFTSIICITIGITLAVLISWGSYVIRHWGGADF